MLYVKTYYRNGTTSQEEPFGQTLIHCNFGWTGQGNGYYGIGVFDLRHTPGDLEDGLDENTPPRGVLFNMDLRIITYNEIPL